MEGSSQADEPWGRSKVFTPAPARSQNVPKPLHRSGISARKSSATPEISRFEVRGEAIRNLSAGMPVP